MKTDHPLTLTVEQAGRVLGVGRSTAYELVRSGDLPSIRLRRRIVVPVAEIAERLGATPDDVLSVIFTGASSDPPSPSSATPIERPKPMSQSDDGAMTLF